MIIAYKISRESEKEGLQIEGSNSDTHMFMRTNTNNAIKGIVALGNAFSPQLKGLAKLQSIQARVIFGRNKFEKYLKTEWQFGDNPCFKLPLEMQVASYPQAYRYYDGVPLIF